MKLSLTALKVVADPNVLGFMVAVAQNSARSLIGAVTFPSFVDNSTGVAGSALAAVPTQTGKVAQSGTNLASRTAFNTAIGKTNDAVAVLAGLLNLGMTPMALSKPVGGGAGTVSLTGATGTVAVAGTVPAQDKTVAGVDGSAGNSMLRLEFNAAVTRARNNLATLMRGYNLMATAIGVATIKNDTLGGSDKTYIVSTPLTATTAVAAGSVATSDLATKVAADAALTVLANDIAFISAKISGVLFLAANFTTANRVPIVLVR